MSGMDGLRERIARALWDRQQEVTSRKYPGFIIWRWDEIHEDQRALFRDFADAVIAALGLRPNVTASAVERFGAQESDGTVYGWEPDVETVRREWPGMPVMRCRYYLTPWERIEEDG